MKNIFATLLMLCFAGAVSAQNLSRAGFYMDNGQAVYANPKNGVTVSVTVEKTHFEPGVFARYAQKMLGVRASLTERTESKIASSAIYEVAPTTPLLKSVEGAVADAILPAFRTDNRALSVEQQAQAAADMIFSLRRHRKELITGEAGENVFGAGLKAALEEIAEMEKSCLAMFYGKTSRTEEIHTFNIVINPSQLDYTVCRISGKSGVVANDDLSAEPVVLHLEPAAPKEYAELQPLGPKDKVSVEYLVVAQTKCSLINETLLLDSQELVLLPFAKSVVAKPIR